MNTLHNTLVSLAGILALASVSRADVDSNANGASDIWERMFNGGELFTALDMNADPDGDGWSNAKEALAGTDPFNSAPPLGLLQTEITSHPTVAGTFTLSWTPVAGKQTTLYVSPDLETWTLFDTFPSTGGEEIELAMDVSHPDGSSPEKLFWRVMVFDTYSVGNGLSDYETQALGMTPGFSDTNSNLIPDDFETANSGVFSVFPPVLATKMPRLQTQTKPLFLWNDTGAAVNYTVTVNGADVPVYSHLDSLTGGVTYAWEEISVTGTKLATVSNTDDAFEAAPFSGFTFPFYGQNYSQVFVNPNGLLSFGVGTTSYSNTRLPNSSAPPGIIAVLWDDLDTRDANNSGEVFYKQESDRFIIQYQDVTVRGRTDTLTFQAILFADGRIQLRYKTINGTTSSATVGVQNQTKDDGLEILYNAAYLAGGLAIEIVPVSEFLKLNPATGSVPAHSSFSLDAVFDSFRLVPGAYYAQVDVSHDAPTPSPIKIPARLEVENVPGTVALTSPAEGFSILEGKSVNFSATATDPEGVARVEFYYDSVKFGEDLTSSYSFSTSSIPAGTHYITARVVDVFGQIVDSTSRTLTIIADSDGDGIPNDWEIANGLDPNFQGDATLDADSDGYTNLEEYTLGKNPNLAEDSDGDGIPDGIERKLVIPLGGSSYRSFDLGKMDTDDNGINDGNEDYDRDGLTTLQEIAAGTDSNKTDTDKDGVNDGKEILIGTNPLVADAFYDAQGVPRDWDNDGLSDVFEVEIGTDPFDDDSNDNGMKDGLEFDLGGTPGQPGPPPAGGGSGGTGPPPGSDPPPTPPTPIIPGSYKILVEEKSVNFPKHGFDTFTEQNPPKRYLSRSSSQTFRGGCPESGPVDITGSASASIDPLTGEETSEGDAFVNTGGDAQSPIRRAGSNSLSSYNDPPNNESDCSGTVNYFTTLSSENTTDMMVSNGKGKLESFEGGEALQPGTPFAYRNVHENELNFDYRKTQFKFKWDDDVTTEQRRSLKCLLIFTPEDDPDTAEDESEAVEVVKTIEWNGQSAESTLYTIDPDTEKSGVDGNYSVLPVEFKVYSAAEPGPYKPHLLNLNTRQNESTTYGNLKKCVAHLWEPDDDVRLLNYLEGGNDSEKRSLFRENLQFKSNGQLITFGGEPAHSMNFVGEPPEDDIGIYLIEVMAKGSNTVIDSMYLTVVPRSTKQKFDTWYAAEKTDTAWLLELPPVFNHIETTPDASGYLPRPDRNFNPYFYGVPNPNNTRFHPDGYFEQRSYATPGGHGHQVWFDANGTLIESGVSAGSADKAAAFPANTNPLLHVEADVEPFMWCLHLDGNPARQNGTTLTNPIMHEGIFLGRYIEVRPVLPNNKPRLEPGATP